MPAAQTQAATVGSGWEGGGGKGGGEWASGRLKTRLAEAAGRGAPGEREHVEDVDVVQVDVLVLRLGFGVKHGVAPDGALLLVHAPEEHHPLAV